MHKIKKSAIGLTARRAAVEHLLNVLKDKHAWNSSQSEKKSAAKLSNEDIGMQRALVFGVLRWWRLIDEQIEKQLSTSLKPKDLDIRIILAIGVFQLWFLRVPAHAAVDSSVNLIRERKSWAAGLANAILRRLADYQLTPQDYENTQWSHPEWMVKMWQHDWPDFYQQIIQAHQEAPPFIIRINPKKNTPKEFAEKFYNLQQVDSNQEAAELKFYSAFPEAAVITPAMDVHQLPGFNLGEVSVQDISAQMATQTLLSAVLTNTTSSIENTRWLDACAAPGGKTAYLYERLPMTAEIVAIELDGQRIQRLKNTLQRVDTDHSVQIIQGDATQPETWWDEKQFDAILLDAPCSGSGVIRRHPDIKWLRQPNDLIALAEQQSTMLKKLWPLLMPNGYLLYATCSTFRVENDSVILNFIKNRSDIEIISIKESSSEITSKIQTECGIQIFPSTYFVDNPLSCQTQNSFLVQRLANDVARAARVKPAQHTAFSFYKEGYVSMVSECRNNLENYSVAGRVMPSGDGFYYCLLRKKI